MKKLPFSKEHILVLGGARSGKSQYAQSLSELILKHNGFITNDPDSKQCQAIKGLYIATAQPLDNEMTQRIEEHKKNRGEMWHTIEEPYFIAKTLKEQDQKWGVILIDCLTLWMTNMILNQQHNFIEQQVSELVSVLQDITTQCILVSNEVSLGIVPPDPVSREFRDRIGLLHQTLAEICQDVVFLVAGLPAILKGRDIKKVLKNNRRNNIYEIN